MELESNVRLLGELATDASASLDNAQNDLVVITDELAQLALQMSVLNGKSITLNTIGILLLFLSMRIDEIMCNIFYHSCKNSKRNRRK